MILVLQTADNTTHCWLYASQYAAQPQASLEWESGRQLSEELLGRLQQFLEEHRKQWPDLTGIVIFSGPGSFTSLRIGHATVNALADGLGIPVIGCEGRHWISEGLAQLKTAPPGVPAMPHYGSEPNITKPKS